MYFIIIGKRPRVIKKVRKSPLKPKKRETIIATIVPIIESMKIFKGFSLTEFKSNKDSKTITY